MIEIIIVTALGSVIGKKIKNLLLLVILCISVGFSTALLTSVIVELIGYTTPFRALDFIFSMGLTIYPVFALISALLTKLFLKLRTNKNPQMATTTKPKQFKTEDPIITESENDEYLWARAHDEVNSDLKQDLWIKCLYKSEHDEPRAVTLYVHERVKQLKNQELELRREILSEEWQKKKGLRLIMLIIVGVLSIIPFWFVSIIISDSVSNWLPSPFLEEKRVKDLESMLQKVNSTTLSDTENQKKITMNRTSNFNYWYLNNEWTVKEWQQVLNREISRRKDYIMTSKITLFISIASISFLLFIFMRLLKKPH